MITVRSTMMLAVVATAIVGQLGAAAEAPRFADPDEQAARRHYDRGVALYDQERYGDAVREFETAKRIKPLPAFDYNIGRCYDRLENWGAAADAYERYVAASPSAPEAKDLRARIAMLRQRSAPAATTGIATAPAPSAEPTDAPVTHRWWFWTAIGAVVVAGAAVGIGVAASESGHAPTANTTDGTFTVRF